MLLDDRKDCLALRGQPVSPLAKELPGCCRIGAVCVLLGQSDLLKSEASTVLLVLTGALGTGLPLGYASLSARALGVKGRPQCSTLAAV
jgi:hypothetical protein